MPTKKPRTKRIRKSKANGNRGINIIINSHNKRKSTNTTTKPAASSSGFNPPFMFLQQPAAAYPQQQHLPPTHSPSPFLQDSIIEDRRSNLEKFGGINKIQAEMQEQMHKIMSEKRAADNLDILSQIMRENPADGDDLSTLSSNFSRSEHIRNENILDPDVVLPVRNPTENDDNDSFNSNDNVPMDNVPMDNISPIPNFTPANWTEINKLPMYRLNQVCDRLQIDHPLITKYNKDTYVEKIAFAYNINKRTHTRRN